MNPLTSKSDWLINSPFSITAESNIKVMRIQELKDSQHEMLLIIELILHASYIGNE